MSNQVTGKRPPYTLVIELIESLGGRMTWASGGYGGGGVWELELRGRFLRVEARDDKVNYLDHLYVAKVPNPTNWKDYEPNAPLVADAFWRVIGLPWKT
jgi:hypothetical protein